LDTSQYLSMFLEESKDHLQAINDHLLMLEGEPNNIGIVQEIFRSAHTLKGMSASMGFEDLASLTHQMENVLDLVRNGQKSIDENVMEVIFSSVDALEQMVHSIEVGGDGKLDVSAIVQHLEAIVRGEASGGSAGISVSRQGYELDDYQRTIILQSLESGFKTYHIHIKLEEHCVLKAARAYMVFTRLEEYGEVIHSNPSSEDIEQEKFERSFDVTFVTESASAEDVQKWLLSISEIESADVVTMTIEFLSSVVMDSTTPLVEASSLKTAAESAVAVELKATPTAPSKKAAANKTVRVDIDRLDKLMNLFSELVIDKGRLEQLSREIGSMELTETTEHMARISSNMQDLMLKLRMVPVDQVFNRFPRMIRDLAKDLGKKVNLTISGSETELDRTVVDEIGDPLVHLLRNAVDHGLETPEDRLKQGKDETGTLSLRAFHSGNYVYIEIQDNGRGINPQSIAKKAIEKGIITAEAAEKMPDHQIYQLLFASGFSTAEKISDISGRGVGLDVVKNKIESLGGLVTIESMQGQGTTFSVQLPLTLSIISAMLVRMGEERYAVPLSNVVETLACKKEDIIVVHGQPTIRLRDKIIPLLPVNDWFEIKASNNEADSNEMELMIIQKGSKWGAMKVDSFIGQQEIVIKPLSHYFGSIQGLSGATILGNGQVALIMDTNHLL
jgi:two-component system chemotaxis sensor kinase CheA